MISKVLAKRLFKVLTLIISDCQHAFIDGRHITDAILIANEVIDDMINNKREGILCKLDIEKVFHHFYWDFFDYIFNRMGFAQKWRRWIR